MINPYSIPSAMAASFTLMLGIFVLCRSPKERLNRLFFRFTISIFIWLFTFAVGYSLTDPRQALLAFRLAYFGVVFIPVLCLHFHLEFLSIYWPKTIRVLYGISGLFLSISHTPYFFKGVKHYFWGYYPQAGPLYLLFIVFFAGVIGTSVTLLIFQLMRGYVKGDAQAFKFQQLKYLALSFIMAYSGSVDFISKFGIEFYPFGYLNITLFAMILTYAMLRHRLMDVETMMQLFQQHKLATLGLLAAGLNHEIRNPLYIVRGNAESYIDAVERGVFKTQEEAVGKAKDIFKKTVDQSERAIDIIKRFSSFVKFSRNFSSKEEVDINLCVQNVLEFLSHEMEGKKIQIETFGGENLKIRVNRREIEEVLFNIVLNACQAMGDEGKLTITTLRQDEKCLVLIKDTGPGVPPHMRKKIFEPFYSGRMEKGTGLGLYICQFLMEQNAGKIQVDSKVGAGTVFILNFPLHAGKSARTEHLVD